MKRGPEKIYPWNFEKVVDLDRSAEAFITRMTAKCSYIGERVLPKCSLLYTRFVALNMINKICVNGKPISVEMKQRIFNECLLKKERTNFKQVSDYMLSNGLIQNVDEISGIDKEFKVSMPGYAVFRRILSDERNIKMVEDIILHMTVLGDESNLLQRWLKKEYGDVLDEDDRNYIVLNRRKFSGWGKLSEGFLETKIKHTDPETGELISIMDMLWRTNDNLMELLSAKYTFAQAIDKYREQAGVDCYKMEDILEDSYASPAIKRSIYQAMRIISEIEKIMKGKPKRVFVEVTRGEGEKKRTSSRKAQLEALYDACKKEIEPELRTQLQGKDEAELRRTKLYLYFTQMGKCMYSGEPIDLSMLDAAYDIDHIYPRSRIKDDGLSNRVLVKRELNEKKGNVYPISETIRQNPKATNLWNTLRKNHLISEEKYRRLTRNTAFTDDELSDFIARQLVETSQACKIVADLLKRRYDDDRVVYVKAGNVSSFRQDQKILPDGTQKQAFACKGEGTKQDPLFVKCREINDFHHAKDAYLNIVVGNVYHVKFTRDPRHFIHEKQTYSLNCVFDWDVVRNGERAWQKGDTGSIAMVRRMMAKNNILVTRWAHEESGGLFDQTIQPKGTSDKLAMIKSSDPRMTTEKYGGYPKLKGAYFCLVEHKKNKKRERSIEAVLLVHKALYEKEPIRYCEEKLQLIEPRILIKKIKFDELISWNGFKMYIASRTGDKICMNNANQLVLDVQWQQYIKELAKYKQSGIHNGMICPSRNLELYILLRNKLGSKTYENGTKAWREKLERAQDRFAQEGIDIQRDALLQILKLFRTGAAQADLTMIGEKPTTRLLKTKNLREKQLKDEKKPEIKLIHQSVTGVFEQEIDLLGDFV